MDFCSRAAVDEPLIGTLKTPARVWIMLEYNGPWRERAIEDNDLPFVAQEWLTAALNHVPDSKALFIKQAEPQGGTRLFVADTPSGRLWAFHLPDYAALAEVDIEAVLQGEVADTRPDPLMLVCTNGKRDACCAKFGRATYEAMTTRGDIEVWQSTHVTGHRYAATGIAFPAGVFYGRMDGHAAAIIEAVNSQQIALAHYRGKAHYPRPAQIADGLVRKAEGLTGGDDLRLIEAPPALTGDRWQVAFRWPDGEVRHVTVERQQVGVQAASGCSQPDAIPVYTYRLRE